MTRGGKYHGLIELYPLKICVNSFAFPRMSFSVNFFVTKIIVFYIYRVNSAAVDERGYPLSSQMMPTSVFQVSTVLTAFQATFFPFKEVECVKITKTTLLGIAT